MVGSYSQSVFPIQMASLSRSSYWASAVVIPFSALLDIEIACAIVDKSLVAVVVVPPVGAQGRSRGFHHFA
jgi:hypothetical protein